MENRQLGQLFLDCDGVLADFDGGFQKIFGMDSRDYEAKHGSKAFWTNIRKEAPNFFLELDLMPGAGKLWNFSKKHDPIILTGCPRGGWAEPQKVQWAKNKFKTDRIITCMARNKRDHGKPGDVLVDDTLKHRHLWEEMGGIFVHHTNVNKTIAELMKLGY